ncbi:hypothetical protein ABPG72_013788 [Tetrahymena utriculariae]
MEGFLETVRSYYKEFVQTVQIDTTEVKNAYNQFDTEVKQPVCKYYSTLHTDLTKIKKDYIYDNLNDSLRLNALIFLTLSSAYLNKKLFRRSLMSTLRVSVVTYFGLGLFLYPEVYNPIFCLQGERYNCTQCESQEQKSQ